ncbi:uncharacterized protein LOC125668607 isoform X2 [Ostrea edulis]|uniref:uncharacterized protein LOC125668607 isoform X2 n=1 Tax=Ostrea edulis TaxID=37623 RepID=UPI0024AF4011|nr:uncharacterized protein LOC125668607 isoform X2 [Ostrea edulis]
MASADVENAGLDSSDLSFIKNIMTDSNSVHESIDKSYSIPGAQLSDKQTFRSREGNAVNAFPVLVDFRRLLQLAPSLASLSCDGDNAMIHGISNRDLLHAVVGLYDVSLSDMTPDVLYSSVCDKWARTVILVRDVQETIEDLTKRKPTRRNLAKKEEEEDGEGEDKYEEEEVSPSKFATVYSDTESEPEDEEDDEEDFSKGINSFIQKAAERRTQQKSTDTLCEELVGIENRIIGAITFEKKYIQKDRVIHLTLLSVRKRYRKFGIGKYLLQQILEPEVVGHYDAIVVHADNGAVEFFQKFGFSDDIVLNSRWSELAEQFTNCTLMSYLPAFSGHTLLSTLKIPGLEVFELEQQFNKWKEKTTEVYQQQVSIVMRMKHEMIQLKCMNEKQNQLIDTLIMENERLKKEKLMIEKEYLDHRLSAARSALYENDKGNDNDEDEIDTSDLISGLQKEVDLMDLSIKRERLQSLVDSDPITRSKFTTVGESQYMSFPTTKNKKQGEPYDHMKDAAFFYDVTEQFKKGMKSDNQIKGSYEVTSISKATLSELYVEKYREQIKIMKDPSLIADLYFCGGLEHPKRLNDILKHGFKESDFVYGEFGRGLYFSKYPSKAAQFSALGKILLVEVGLGNMETVTKHDKTRKSPSSSQFDSIITPGRLQKSSEEGNIVHNEEYVVYNLTQILPLCLISYAGS